MKVININGYYIGFPGEDDELRFQFPNELLIFLFPVAPPSYPCLGSAGILRTDGRLVKDVP